MQLSVEWFISPGCGHTMAWGAYMNLNFSYKEIIGYILLFSAFILVPLWGNHAVMTQSQSLETGNCVVIDAGHGGIDGGAVSPGGEKESHINLQISQKLESVMQLLGIRTKMIRTTDRSIHISGNTIAAQKVSDIRERVRIVNTTLKALLVSIHQNNFTDSQYYGAQVFHNSLDGSDQLAEMLQTNFRTAINPQNKRQCKKAAGIYLMDHINCRGVLIECGFLSNPQEAQQLMDGEYQRKLCCVIAATVSQYLNT